MSNLITFLYTALCFILPNTIWQLINRKKLRGNKDAVRHVVWTYIFFIYCSMALYVAGVGTIWNLISNKGELTGRINLTLFSPDGFMQYFLNVIMFMPFGFLLPYIWEEFRSFKKSLLAGFCFSLTIETIQLFNYRVSDVDDLMTNTFGTFVGYMICMAFIRIFKHRKKTAIEIMRFEPVAHVILGVLGVFILLNYGKVEGIENRVHLLLSNI